jgi:hypothetical protein
MGSFGFQRLGIDRSAFRPSAIDSLFEEWSVWYSSATIAGSVAMSSIAKQEVFL